jgi:hypothetical protein
MAQIFQQRTVLGIKLALIAAAVAITTVTMWMYDYNRGPITVDEAPQQPVPFSHKHHVGDDGIDCRYCHQSVERGRFAGLPSTQVCMTCHSQIFSDARVLEPVRKSARTGERLAWARVYSLPGFAYFDHSIHVAKGVGCVECHGRVDRMPLTRRAAPLEMQWCLECHRNPAPHLRPPERVFDMTPTNQLRIADRAALVRDAHMLSERRRTDCSTCHR